MNAQRVGRMMAREAWRDGAAVAGAVYPSLDTSWHNLKVSEETGVKT